MNRVRLRSTHLSNFWTVVTALATLISTVAYIVTALYIRAQLQAVDKDRYLNVTSDLFSIWQDEQFMRDQLWLIHKLQEKTWEDFVKAHRADYGEIAFHRVGSYYDRIGTLSRLKVIDATEILSTVGGYAIAVWQSIEPLVREARRLENSVLFDDFEKLLPECYECYVPALGEGAFVRPFSGDKEPPKISTKALKKKMDAKENVYVLDVRQPDHYKQDPRVIPGAIYMPPDEVERRYTEIPPNREIAVYCA